MSSALHDTLDYLVANLSANAWRDHAARIHAGIALLDKHGLWKPRTADAKRASAALVQSLIRTIYNLFGDPICDAAMFRRADKQCGAACARVVEAFGLEKHRLVKAFWTTSRFGAAAR